MPPEQNPTPPRIIWTEVTWYSKLLAALLFVGLVCGAFLFGVWYQKQVNPIETDVDLYLSETQGDSPSEANFVADYTDAIHSSSSRFRYEVGQLSPSNSCIDSQPVFCHSVRLYSSEGALLGEFSQESLVDEMGGVPIDWYGEPLGWIDEETIVTRTSFGDAGIRNERYYTYNLETGIKKFDYGISTECCGSNGEMEAYFSTETIDYAAFLELDVEVGVMELKFVTRPHSESGWSNIRALQSIAEFVVGPYDSSDLNHYDNYDISVTKEASIGILVIKTPQGEQEFQLDLSDPGVVKL